MALLQMAFFWDKMIGFSRCKLFITFFFLIAANIQQAQQAQYTMVHCMHLSMYLTTPTNAGTIQTYMVDEHNEEN